MADGFIARQDELYEQLKGEYITPENIARVAYQLWEDEGHPDGNEWIETALGKMPRRDYHWLHAKAILELHADVDSIPYSV